MKEYKNELKGFPQEIIDKMVERQVEQGNKPNPDVFDKNIRADEFRGGFNWHETSEYSPFWADVLEDKKFDLFFQKYPKKREKPQECTYNPETLDISIFTPRIMEYDYKYYLSAGDEFELKSIAGNCGITSYFIRHRTHSIKPDFEVTEQEYNEIIKLSIPIMPNKDIWKPQECTSNPYPKVMWVWDNNEATKVKRVILMEKNGKYLAWSNAETFEEAEKSVCLVSWAHAEDIQPQDQITSLMNYLVEIGHNPVTVLDNEQMIRDIVPEILSEKCNCKTKNE
jgi:hypothetical protein